MARNEEGGVKKTASRDSVSRLKMKPGRNHGCVGCLYKGPFFFTWLVISMSGQPLSRRIMASCCLGSFQCVPLLLPESARAVFNQNWGRV